MQLTPFLFGLIYIWFVLDIQMSNVRPQSPVLMEGHIPKLSSSPPKAASGWHNLNPVHKKGTLV